MTATGNEVNLLAETYSTILMNALPFTRTNAGTIYASFLIQILNGTAIPQEGAFFLGFSNSDWISGFPYAHIPARIWIRTSTTGDFDLGISKNSNTVGAWTTDAYSFNTTLLIVVKYEIVGDQSEKDDIVSLFVNPDLSGTEPVATITTTDALADDDVIGNFFIRQTIESPNAYIDAIRIATSWDLAPLPIELSQFSASTTNSSVELKWKTETEVNNYGFEVQRSSKSEEWHTLGFVNGNGNSNSPKNYSYEDKSVNTSGAHSYRLKQIDNDGSYEYSKTIEVHLGTPANIDLKQNYPNPFNPSTTINFTLPVVDQVSLVVYNAIGEQVKVLYNGMLEAGVHSFNFNGDELPSGLYVYKLTTSTNTQIRKMMLLK